MSVIEPSRSEGRQPGPPDDLEARLRTFFQSELPSPWPALRLPEASVVPAMPVASPRWTSASSRLALAASVGLLLTGTLLMSGGPSADRPDRSTGEHIGFRPQENKVRIPTGEEFEMRESLKQEKGKPTEYLIEFQRR